MAFFRHVMLFLISLVPSHVMAEEVARTISLKEIIYKSPTNWEISLNDQKITATSIPPSQIMDLQVSEDTIRMKWFDKKLDGVLDVKLAPFQTYDIELDRVERLPVAPPSGMTADEWRWVETAIITSMTLSRNYYQSELQSASKNFTREAWGQFTKWIARSKFLDGEKDFNIKDFNIKASLKSPPSLIQTGEREGNQNWLFRVTPYINYSVKTESRLLRTNLRISIERSPVKSSGLVISGWETILPAKK